MSILSFGTLALSGVWMATPDIVAFTANDPPIIPGNIETGSFSGFAYDTWVQRNNPVGGALEYCCVFGPNKDRVRYSDKPNPLGYLDKVALRTLANYTVTGATATAVYYRDEANGQGEARTPGTDSILTQRHTVYLKLSAVPANGTLITIANSQPRTVPTFSFTYNDKLTRAGGIQVNHVGQRPNDGLRYAYLSARIPGGANKGTVDFINTYGKSSFQILNSAKATVYTGSIVQRCNANAVTGEGYDTGMDIADMSQGWTITAATNAAADVNRFTIPGHGFVTGDKARFMGINGMTGLENPPGYTVGSFWVAPTVRVVDANTITLSDYSTVGLGTFTNTSLLSTALGGVNNKVFKCFNTNRAGTFVFGLDFSGWTPGASGTHYIYIPGYGISDPFQIKSDAWALAAAQLHEGIFNLRMGIAVSSSSGYSRGSAMVDGVNGVTNYQSTLPAVFTSESGQAFSPAGAGNVIGAGLGAYVNLGTLTLSGLTCPAATVTATTTAPHGVTVGQKFGIQVQGCTPATYNHGTGDIATSTGASTFTYASPTGLSISNSTVAGFARTGFVTTTRTGGRPGHQDAGDNDGPAYDHIPGWKMLALVFRNIPKPSRFTLYTVPLSSAVLDPVLFAGTDALPPLFHELFWYAEAYRTTQNGNGSIWGGYGYGSFGSQVPNYPEPIDYYRGVSAGGSLTSQTVMGFSYAADHLSTFMYAGLAAQLAQIAYDYSLTALGDAYKTSAIAAYSWADGLATNVATCDAYYKTTLNLQTKAGWSTASYNDAMLMLNENTNGVPGRAIQAKFDAAGSLYRLLGSSAGQSPYGNFIEHKTLYLPTITNGGTGYAVNDYITIGGGTGSYPALLLVTAVSGGIITAIRMMHSGQYTAVPSPPTIASTTGLGTGATFTFSNTFMYNLLPATIGAFDYCATPGANAAAKAAFQGSYNVPHAATGLNPVVPYMGLMFSSTPPGTGGGTKPGVFPVLQAHMNYVAINGIVAGSYSSDYIKVMQAGASWIQGANLTGKAFVTGMGPRPFICLLHEDSYKNGTAGPNGINPYGYFSWGTSFMFSNFAGSLSGVSGNDGPLIFNADNTSGQFESTKTPGSAKMWNPWRGGSSYWEWSPENRLIIYNSEFDLVGLIGTLSMQLYLHGWDGNV
jgi:hypothetical protein